MKLENKVYDELTPGDEASLDRLCTAEDLMVFANVSGNMNPMHLADYDGDGDGVNEAFAPASWIASLVSAVIGNILPGPGALFRSQNFRFHERAQAGDELRAHVQVTGKTEDTGVRIWARVTRIADGALIMDGEAEVLAPTEKLTFDALEVPGLVLQSHVHFDAILDRAAPLPPIPMAVVAPEEPNSLGGALLARRHTIIEPVLVGARAKIEEAARVAGMSLDGVDILDEPDHARAAATAVALVRDGRCGALMKGHLHTDMFLRAVLSKEGGLRMGRRLTHVFVMDVPGVPHPMLVTDAAINIEPDLKTKIDITQNAIDVAISLGIKQPKVGVLSAVEVVNPDMPSSMDAALLSKMAERGQIKGGLVDGPLAMDNAVSIAAARTKGLNSAVAGRAEVLVAPNIDAANMLAKQLTYVAGAEAGGLVLGAKCPLVVTSRADNDKSRLVSCAVAALHWARLNDIRPLAEAAE